MLVNRPVLAACVLLSGLAAATPDKPRLVILELVGSRDVEPAVAKALTEALTAAAGRTGLFQVTSQAEVANLLGLERQRELLGCAESSSSCTAELAGALGAQFLMSGSVTKLGQDAFQLSLQVQDTARAMTLGRASRIASDLASLRALVPVAFAEASATPPPPSPSRVVPVTFLAAGGASVLAGAGLLLQGALLENTLAAELRLGREEPAVPLKPVADYRAQLGTISALRIGGVVAAGLGVAAMVTGILLWPRGEGIVVAPLPGGLMLAGKF
ncbi:MAG: hypothetical protein JNJ54_30010 [Myxococcaceae bacterium]|nr:hypothetical protein [Myxococcaceae bacterium]